MLGSMKAGSPGDSPELRGGMSRGASGALSERMVPRANSNGCAPVCSPPRQKTHRGVRGALRRGLVWQPKACTKRARLPSNGG